MKQIFTFLLSLMTAFVSQAQFAGAVDTTFAPNNNGVPFSTNGYYRVVGVEVVGNSVYYALSGGNDLPKIRKYDFQGNEDESWYSNQMSTWGTQFATTTLEPEKDQSGNYTGKFFICGRNSSNSMADQRVRFLNKINADGTRDLSFVCPIPSWISVCSTVYHDWENNKLYYAYQTGYSVFYQTIVCCDPNTGEVLQTMTLPQPSYLIRKITRVPNTNDILVGGAFDFEYSGHQYTGMFKLDSQFNLAPIEGITDLPNSSAIADVLFVDDSECDVTLTGTMTAYVAGSISIISGVSGLRNIAKFNLVNGAWNIDSNYNAGTSGHVADICYYNCHLIVTGNFASSMPTGPYAPTWTPKVTAFTSNGLISEEFKMLSTGSGLGGVYMQGFEDNFGQGDGKCIAVSPAVDGNDRWEIFVGGTFVNLIQGPAQPNNVIKHVNFMAKLYGFRNTIDTRFTYCLGEGSNGQYDIYTFDMSNTSGCEKWELYQSSNPNADWTLVRTSYSHAFVDPSLIAGVWYKLVRSVTECGNTCSSNYVFYKSIQSCQAQNNGAELRSVIVSERDNAALQQQEVEAAGIVVYPNPSLGVVTINDKLGDAFRNVNLYNSIGVKVLSTTSNTKSYQIDLTDLPSGVYMVVVTTNTATQKQQLIKE